ncbi:MAG TPA: phosphatase PAP2 family protein [Stellaceae bacterium]|nr:phosphatase PAP2 family protein [Stellaceae bacterium]
MRADRWISGIEWGVVALLVAADVAFAAMTGIPVVNWQRRTLAIALLVALWPATLLLTRLAGRAGDASFLAEIPGKAFAYIAAATICEYYCATSQAPLHDPLLIRLDGLLGVRWTDLYALADAHPGIRDVLSYVYFSLGSETCLVLGIIAVFYPRRARRFTTALIVSSLLTIPFLWLFPVAGPLVAFPDLPASVYSDVVYRLGPEHYMAMRNHVFSAIDMSNLGGIVSFPSYHAASAVMLAYFLRGVRFLFPAAAAFNAVMIAATPIIGGHYIVDVIAGVLVGAATIAVIEWIETDRAPARGGVLASA